MPRIKINPNVVNNPGRLRPSMGGGRPTEYKDTYPDQVFRLALLGASDGEIAAFFDVTQQTYYNWLDKHPRFFESVKRGKDEADAHVAHSLYHRALGYSHPAVKIIPSRDEDGVASYIEAPYVEHYPPDTAAAKHWLQVRRRKSDGARWVERQEVSGPDGGAIPIASANVQVSDPIEAAKIYAKIMGES